MDAHNESPVNPLPPVIVVLALAIVGIEAVFYLGSKGIVGGAEAVGWRLQAVRQFGFLDEIFDWMRENGQWRWEHVMRMVTYGFIHLSFVHAVFAAVILLAIGNLVGQVVGNVALAAIFFGSTAFGAAFFGLIQDSGIALLGAYPGAYGMIGAYTYLMWLRLGMMGQRQFQAFSLIGMLMAVQLVFGVLFGSSPDWIADVGGFAAGALIMVFVIPGGWKKIRARLRHK